jgi:mycothiol synthase
MITSAPAPAVQWTFRPFRGEADYEAFAEIGRRCNVADGVPEVETAADIANQYTHLVNTDPARDIWVVEVEGVPVAYQRATWWPEENGTHLYWLFGFVDPAWRRQGLGRELVRRGEQRLREVAAAHTGATARLFSVFTPAQRVSKVALFESEGYRPVRHFYMMERSLADDLPQAPLPAGLDLRPVRPADLRAIWDANEEAFRDHWGYAPRIDEHFVAWRDGPHLDLDLLQIAWDTASGQVAGVAINVINPALNAEFGRQMGTVDELSVRRPWRNRGLGRALLAASLAAFQARGMTTAAIGVDSENPTGAPHLYQSVGFETVSQSMILRKEIED